MKLQQKPPGHFISKSWLLKLSNWWIMKKLIIKYRIRFYQKTSPTWGSSRQWKSSHYVSFGGRSPNYIQKTKCNLEYKVRLRETDNSNSILANENTNEVIRIIKSAFVITFHDARISTSSGTEIEQNNFVGPVSLILRFYFKRIGDLPTYVDENDESEHSIISWYLKQIFIDSHT